MPQNAGSHAPQNECPCPGFDLSGCADVRPDRCQRAGLFADQQPVLPAEGLGADAGLCACRRACTAGRGQPAAGHAARGGHRPRRGVPEPGASSLFRGRSGGGLFAPILRAPPSIKRLLDLIASAEAGKAQYDAVQYGARRKPPKKPTQMTIAEINAWIDATPGQPHAIGRYQFIPATLRRLVRHQGVKPQARFSPELQDQLAHQLIEEAGYSAFLASEMPRKTFMLNLAKIWAGLPVASGKSYYEGYAGNSASLTYAHFKSEMARIFPG